MPFLSYNSAIFIILLVYKPIYYTRRIRLVKDFIITLLFGWLGVHKFIQKKYVLGILYLFTFGLFGIGWFIDIIISFARMLNGEQQTPATQETNIFSDECEASSKRLIKSFDTVIVGTFAKSSKYPDEKREDQIFRIKKNSKLELEFWRYKGDPAYYVCDCGSDVGCIRAGLAKIIYDEYRDCKFDVTALERVMDDRNDCMTYKIRIDIYR